MKLRVTSIQRGCVNDGPGVRTIVFLKGCVYKCPWCCNPETQLYEEEFFFDKSKCLHLKGIYSNLCDGCYVKSGVRDIIECPFKVAVPVSKDYTIDELLAEILRDKTLYDTSNGGVTFSGGEPLMQIGQLLPLLIELKDKGIHVTIETTLAVESEVIKQTMPYVDYWYVDLKLQPEMAKTYRFENVRENIQIIKKSTKDVYYRIVVTNSLFENKNVVIETLRALNIVVVELLRCHNMAKSKYAKLNRNNYDFAVSIKQFKRFSDILIKEGFNVRDFSI